MRLIILPLVAIILLVAISYYSSWQLGMLLLIAFTINNIDALKYFNITESNISSLKTELELHKVENTRLRELQENRVSSLLSEIKRLTRVDADVGYRGNNTIILTGIYRNRGYVQFYDVGGGEFQKMVEELQYMKKYAVIRHVDAPQAFKGTFEL